MTEDDKNFYAFCFAIFGLTILAFLHGRMIAIVSERQADTDADVKFLMDHSVVRETESRP